MEEQQVTIHSLLLEIKELKQMVAVGRIQENSRELWTRQQVAKYFNTTVRMFEGSIMKDPFFPEPINTPSQRDLNKPTAKKCWFVGDIVRYAMNKQQGRF